MVDNDTLVKVREACAKAICYPEHWDTACYPTLLDALKEIGCSECRAITQATGAGLPDMYPFAWVIPGDDQANGDGWLDCRITQEGEFSTPLYKYADVKKLLGAATALQERADATARQRDAECERANELAARLKFDKTFEQRADNLQRELEAANDAIRDADDVYWESISNHAQDEWRKRHFKTIDAARSERGGGGEMAP